MCPGLGQAVLSPLEQGPHGSGGANSYHFSSSFDVPGTEPSLRPGPAPRACGRREPPAEEISPRGVSPALGSAGTGPVQ